MNDETTPPDPEPVEPSVLELLLARIDGHIRVIGLELDQIAQATDQLAPDRARSCRTAVAMTKAMLDEISLRAHARPLTEHPNWDPEIGRAHGVDCNCCAPLDEDDG
jgi:hypothetical protein